LTTGGQPQEKKQHAKKSGPTFPHQSQQRAKNRIGIKTVCARKLYPGFAGVLSMALWGLKRPKEASRFA